MSLKSLVQVDKSHSNHINWREEVSNPGLSDYKTHSFLSWELADLRENIYEACGLILAFGEEMN